MTEKRKRERKMRTNIAYTESEVWLESDWKWRDCGPRIFDMKREVRKGGREEKGVGNEE